MILTVTLTKEEAAHLEKVCGRRKWGHEWALHQIIAAHVVATAVAGVEDPSPTPTEEINAPY